MTNTHEWLEIILDELFKPEMRRIDGIIQRLTEKNSVLKNHRFLGFMHLGEVFIPEVNKRVYTTIPRNLKSRTTPALDFTMVAEVSEFIADHNKLSLDRTQIKQVLFRLIHQVNNKQELRDALPECIVSLIPTLASMSRQMADPTYLIKSDYRSVKDYERMLPKIEMYAMTRLIY